MSNEPITRAEYTAQRDWIEKELGRCVKTDTMEAIRETLAKKIDTVNRQDMKAIYEVLDMLDKSINELSGKVSRLETHISDAPAKKCVEQMYDVAEEEVSRRAFSDDTVRKIAKEVYREFKKEEAEEALTKTEKKLGIASSIIKLLSIIIPVLLFLYVIAQHRIIDEYMKMRNVPTIEMMRPQDNGDKFMGGENGSKDN